MPTHSSPFSHAQKAASEVRSLRSGSDELSEHGHVHDDSDRSNENPARRRHASRRPMLEVETGYPAMVELFHGKGLLGTDVKMDVSIPLELFEAVQNRQKYFHDEFERVSRLLDTQSLELGRLRKETNESKAAAAQAKQDKFVVTARLENLLIANRDMCIKRDEAETEAANAKRELAEMQADREGLKKKLADRGSEVQELQSMLEKSEQMIAQLKEKESSSCSEIRALHEAIKAQRKHIAPQHTNVELPEGAHEEALKDSSPLCDVPYPIQSSSPNKLRNRSLHQERCLEAFERRAMQENDTYDPHREQGVMDGAMVSKYAAEAVKASVVEAEPSPFLKDSPFLDLWPKQIETLSLVKSCLTQTLKTFEHFEGTLSQSADLKELLERWKRFSPRWRANCEAAATNALASSTEAVRLIAERERIATKIAMESAAKKLAKKELVSAQNNVNDGTQTEKSDLAGCCHDVAIQAAVESQAKECMTDAPPQPLPSPQPLPPPQTLPPPLPLEASLMAGDVTSPPSRDSATPVPLAAADTSAAEGCTSQPKPSPPSDPPAAHGSPRRLTGCYTDGALPNPVAVAAVQEPQDPAVEETHEDEAQGGAVPRQSVPEWVMNLLIPPATLHENEHALFTLLPEKYFAFHSLLLQLILVIRRKMRIAFPCNDASKYVGDESCGEAKSIGDVHCVLKFDYDAVDALITALTSSKIEAMKKVLDYKGKVERMRLHALDHRVGNDISKLSMLRREELVKYRLEKAKAERLIESMLPPPTTPPATSSDASLTPLPLIAVPSAARPAGDDPMPHRRHSSKSVSPPATPHVVSLDVQVNPHMGSLEWGRARSPQPRQLGFTSADFKLPQLPRQASAGAPRGRRQPSSFGLSAIKISLPQVPRKQPYALE